MVSKLDESTGFTKKLAEALTWLSENLDTVMKWLKRIAEVGLAVLVYRLIPALIIAWQTAGAAAVTAASTTAAAWASGQPVGVERHRHGGQAPRRSPCWARPSSAGRSDLAVGEVRDRPQGGHLHGRGADEGHRAPAYRWEVFAAIFTSDTIAEATKRHEQRLAEMNRIFAEMYADATKGRTQPKGAMNTAATAAEEIAKRLEAVRQGTQEAVGRGIEAVHAALENSKSRLGEVEQAVGKAQGVVNDATAKMAEAYKGLTAIVEGQPRADAAVKNRYEQKRRNWAYPAVRNRQDHQVHAAAHRGADPATTLRRQATTETLRSTDRPGNAGAQGRRRPAARPRRRAGPTCSVSRTTSSPPSARPGAGALRVPPAHRRPQRRSQPASGEVQRIEEAKRQLSMSTEERIRDIRRQGMTEYEATEDRKRQIAEMQEQARRRWPTVNWSRPPARAEGDGHGAQVATSQTNEAKRGEEARKQSEQAVSQVTQLEAQSREAYRRQEYQQATDADAAGRSTARGTGAEGQGCRRADRAELGASPGHRPHPRVRGSSTRRWMPKPKAHQTAAAVGNHGARQIQPDADRDQTPDRPHHRQAQDGLKGHARRRHHAFSTRPSPIWTRRWPRRIPAPDPGRSAGSGEKLKEYEQLLKEGKTLPVDADVSKAKEALDKAQDLRRPKRAVRAEGGDREGAGGHHQRRRDDQGAGSHPDRVAHQVSNVNAVRAPKS